MNQKEYELIAGCIARTAQIIGLDKNQVRRQAKRDALRLLTSDLTGTLRHYYPKTFDEDKFLANCGL